MPKRCAVPLTCGKRISGKHGLTSLFLLVLASLNAGCATISLSEPHVVARRVLHESADTEVLAKASVDVQQDGVSATIRALHLCGDRKTAQVQVTTARERHNDSAPLDWGLGIAGLATAGVGTGLIIDSRNVYPKDTTSRDYNPYGQDTALGIGVAVTAVGAALLAVSGVDVLRAQGQEIEVEQIEERGEKLANLQPCNDEPYSGLVVSVGGNQAGTTDQNGEVQFDLTDLFDEDLFVDAKATNPQVSVFVTNKRVGTLSLTPVAEHYARLRDERDESKWLAADVDSCRSPESLDACSSVDEYLEQYPSGLHGAEARQLLKDAEPKLAELRDDAEWESIKSDSVPGCLKPASEDACDPVKRYVEDRPDGRYLKEAQAVLRRAGPALTALRLKRERKERSQAAMQSVIAVDGVRVGTDSPPLERSGRVFIRVTFDATLKKSIPARTSLFVRAACKVGGRRMVDTAPVLASLDDLMPGDTKEFEAMPFINRPLSRSPTGCTIQFSMGTLFGGGRRPLGEFCYGNCE